MAYVDIPIVVGGKVNVYRNGKQISPIPGDTPYARYIFDIGQAFKFEAVAASGYDFIRWCGNPECSFSSSLNPFADYITAEAGYIKPIFREQPPTKEYVDGELAKLEKKISAMEKALGTQIMEVLAGIQDAGRKIEKEIQDRAKAVLDIEARVKAWITETIFELLMKNLNAAAIEYKKQRGKT